MTIEKLKERRKELGYSYEQLAGLSGIALSTIQKIFGGRVASPRYETLRRIEDVLYPDIYSRLLGKKQGQYTVEDYYRLPPYMHVELIDGVFYGKDEDYSLYPAEEQPAELRDAHEAYGTSALSTEIDEKQGHHTLEDYYALPEGRRVELIDGYFYDMAAPNPKHQAIAGEIFTVFRSHIRTNKGDCCPFMSPIDVKLFPDEPDMVQPDVLVICDRNKIDEQRIEGAPDLVVEILSKSNTKKEMTRKLMKYRKAGVREYWEIDPEEKLIQVYVFDDSGKAETCFYSFNEKVPVSIWNGNCEVDFAEVSEAVSYLDKVKKKN